MSCPGRVVALIGCLAASLSVVGCGSAHWVRNGLLDPTQVGQFSKPRRNEIRHTLSILEEPEGIQNAEEPTPEDLVARYRELKIAPGDAVSISIYELLTPGMGTALRLRVGNSGFETIPLVGPVRVVGFTPRELELELKQRLREAEIIEDADVQVSMLESQASQCSIVGSVTRPGVYPLPGPEYRLLNVIAAAGGIPPVIEKIYVFQKAGQQESQPDLEEGGPRGEPRRRGGAAIPYTMSDVSSGSAGASDQQPPASGPTTGESGSRELDVLERLPAGKQPRIEWDEELGEWVIGDMRTQPVTRRAVQAEAGSAPVETERVAVEEAERPSEAVEDLVPPIRIIEIPVKELMEGDPRYNVVIRPYDLINVPPGAVGEFYMMGNVARPGAYSLTGRRLTVKEAIASAGGFGPLAWPARADLVRRVSQDEEQIIQLDLDAIFAGEAPDFYLKPNDIVNVGTTPAAVFFAVLRNAFRFTYGMGFVYDRNFADSDTFAAREQVKQRRQFEAQAKGIPF